MEWMNKILDHISKYGIRKITKLERSYLDNYNKDTEETFLEQLNKRYEYYKSLYTYDIKNLSWLDSNLANNLSDDEIMFARLNLLWDNFESEDCYIFQEIYDIPDRIVDKSWSEVPKKYKLMFDNYWKEYYNFNI